MADIPEHLALPNRAELPLEVAVLRERYPRPEWAEHANYGELSAFWLHVHDSLRQQGRALQEFTLEFRENDCSNPGEFQRRFMPGLGQYLQHLEGHHHIEDSHYFPRFRSLDRRVAFGFDLLENDHDIIHRGVTAVVASARAFMQALSRDADAGRYAGEAYVDESDRLLRLLEQHLSDEEDLVIPAMLEHSERPLR